MTFLGTRFRALLRRMVTIAPFANAHNPDGTPKYGAPVTYQARVRERMKLVRTAAGDERVSTATIWLEGSPPVTVQDRLTLPDGRRPPILAIERPEAEHGFAATFIYV